MANVTEQFAVPGDGGVEGLYSARLLNTPAGHRTFFRWVRGIVVVGIAILFLPWQQNVQGKGVVTALSPGDRPQDVVTVIAGRIEEWYVPEGQYVTKGAPLVRISEVKEKYLDPGYVDRLGEQVAGKTMAIDQKMRKVASMDALIVALERSLELGRSKAQNKVSLYEAAYRAAVQDSVIAQDQVDRMEGLERDGLISLNSVQGFRLKAQQASAKLVEKRQELENARLEVGSVEAEYGEKIAKARADREATLAEVGEGQADVAKLRNEFRSGEIRNGLYLIQAPQDGYVVRALKTGIGEQLKEGDPVLTIVPSRPALAVELHVKAMDVPLLRPGRQVRLQFDGWPALQFTGWPSVSVGTFGGIIRVVDRVADTKGTFRILVVPDPADEAWPAQLRMDSGVNGWALLDTVPVWFEIWRQLNGFPPSIDPSDVEQESKPSGVEKGDG